MPVPSLVNDPNGVTEHPAGMVCGFDYCYVLKISISRQGRNLYSVSSGDATLIKNLIAVGGELDRSRSVPLHRQLAALLRLGIANGDLPPGTQLPPIRQAAELLGVHYHTVRKTYSELKASGLVDSGPAVGTRVAEASIRPDNEGLELFLQEIRRRAAAEFGLSPRDLSDSVLSSYGVGSAATPVWIVECSQSLAEGLAGQVRDTLQIDARAWTLDRLDELPAGRVVGTYYHAREFRGFAARSARSVDLVAVRVDTSLLSQLQNWQSLNRIDELSISLVGVDCDSAFAMASEIRTAVKGCRTVTTESGGAGIDSLRNASLDGVVIFSPEAWDRLPDEYRSDRRAHRYQTRIVDADLRRLAQSQA